MHTGVCVRVCELWVSKASHQCSRSGTVRLRGAIQQQYLSWFSQCYCLHTVFIQVVSKYSFLYSQKLHLMRFFYLFVFVFYVYMLCYTF